MDAAEKRYGREHYEVARTLISLGRVTYDSAEWSLALAHYERARTILVSTPAVNVGPTADAMIGAARALVELERVQEAERELRQAIVLSSGRAKHGRVGDARFELAKIHALRAEALPAIDEAELALAAYERERSPDWRGRDVEVRGWLSAHRASVPPCSSCSTIL